SAACWRDGGAGLHLQGGAVGAVSRGGSHVVSRSLRFGLIPTAVALGVFAEWASLRRGPFEPAPSSSDIRLVVADFVVGVVLVGCGAFASDRRPESWTGALLTATGFAWFLGTFAASGWPGFSGFGSPFVTLHRG